jgi:IS30 family transposase
MATHLTPEEREVLSQMLAQGLTRRAIAKVLGRDVSTIYRELRRNGHRGLYCAVHAQACAERRRREARRRSRKMQRPELREYVQLHLRKCWSPEQIAGRLPWDDPENPALRISHQTIYAWLATDDHRRRWRRYLRRYRPRKRRCRAPQQARRARNLWPEIITRRERYGGWEGDTIVRPPRSRSALVSLVERKSGYLELIAITDRQAVTTNHAIYRRLSCYPDSLRQSLTLDNGSEFSQPQALTASLHLAVFFTDPHSPWQRGTNENTNGLARQFFPKGTCFSKVSHYKVAQVQDLLNHRPRKRLGFRTPSEVLQAQRGRAIQT